MSLSAGGGAGLGRLRTALWALSVLGHGDVREGRPGADRSQAWGRVLGCLLGAAHFGHGSRRVRVPARRVFLQLQQAGGEAR